MFPFSTDNRLEKSILNYTSTMLMYLLSTIFVTTIFYEYNAMVNFFYIKLFVIFYLYFWGNSSFW